MSSLCWPHWSKWQTKMFRAIFACGIIILTCYFIPILSLLLKVFCKLLQNVAVFHPLEWRPDLQQSPVLRQYCGNITIMLGGTNGVMFSPHHAIRAHSKDTRQHYPDMPKCVFCNYHPQHTLTHISVVTSSFLCTFLNGSANWNMHFWLLLVCLHHRITRWHPAQQLLGQA